MTQQEFAHHAIRLYTEWKRTDDFTPDRLRVLVERFGHLPLEVWSRAVDSAILEPEFPFPKRLENIVAEAREWVAQTEADAHRAEAARLPSGGVAEVFGSLRGGTVFADRCAALGQLILHSAWTPGQCAEWLRDQCDASLVLDGMDCRAWVGALESAVDWREMPVKPVLVSRVRAPQQLLGGPQW